MSVEYISANFSVDRSGYVSFRLQTHTQMQLVSHPTMATTGVGTSNYNGLGFLSNLVTRWLVLLRCSAQTHQEHTGSGCLCTKVRRVESLESLAPRSKNFVRYWPVFHSFSQSCLAAVSLLFKLMF